MADTVLERVEASLRRWQLARPGDHVIVAVSGGADSVALLACLRDLAPRWSLRVRIAHVHHGLRADADTDARFVAALAAAWALPLDLERAEVGGYAKSHHLSIEAAAREVRYAFLRQTAARRGARTVAVGHTADDQVETVLLRFLRGGHPAGMWPRRPIGEMVLIRPLLDLSRRELRADLQRRGLPWREDPSNQDLRHLRNRLRHDLIPALAGYIPGVKKSLKQTADALVVDDQALEALAEAAEATVISPAPDGAALHRGRLLLEPEAVRRRLFRRAVSVAGGNIRRLGFVHMEEGVRLAAEGRHGQRLSLPGLVLEVRGDDLLLLLPAGSDGPVSVYEVPERGRVDAVPFGLVVESELLPARDADLADGAAYLDADRVRPPLMLRAWREGDRFRPLGMLGKKKVGDFLTDAKVPRLRRSRIAVLETAEGTIVWVVGWRVAEETRVTPATRRVLRLRALAPGGVSPAAAGMYSLNRQGGG